MSLNGENLEKVECFRYLGVDMGAKVSHRVDEGLRSWLHRVCGKSSLHMRAKMGMFDGILVP